MLVVPFMKNKQNLEFYSILVPFIFFHWSVNDDTCALTQMEMAVTGNKKEETFFGRVVGPIYKMDDNAANNLLKSLLFFLWLLVQFRLNRVDLSPLQELKKRILKASLKKGSKRTQSSPRRSRRGARTRSNARRGSARLTLFECGLAPTRHSDSPQTGLHTVGPPCPPRARAVYAMCVASDSESHASVSELL